MMVKKHVYSSVISIRVARFLRSSVLPSCNEVPDPVFEQWRAVPSLSVERTEAIQDRRLGLIQVRQPHEPSCILVDTKSGLMGDEVSLQVKTLRPPALESTLVSDSAILRAVEQSVEMADDHRAAWWRGRSHCRSAIRLPVS
jgi:hypothetical protein